MILVPLFLLEPFANQLPFYKKPAFTFHIVTYTISFGPYFSWACVSVSIIMMLISVSSFVFNFGSNFYNNFCYVWFHRFQWKFFINKFLISKFLIYKIHHKLDIGTKSEHFSIISKIFSGIIPSIYHETYAVDIFFGQYFDLD